MTYNNIKAWPSIFAGACLLCFSHVAPGAYNTIWQGQSGGLNVHWTKTDITATQGGKRLFSARALAQKDFQADFLTGNEAIDCEYQRKFRLLSVVGNIANLEESEYVKCQGTAPPSSETRFTAVDFANGGKVLKLTDFFAESDILKALLADNLLKKALAHSKTPPSTLQALYEALEWSAITIRNCEYGLSEDFLSQFAFHHLSRNRVAIRLNLLLLTHACQSKSRQLGFYLTIPTALKSALNQANRGKAGFLMTRSIAGKKSTRVSFSTTTYSPPVSKGRDFSVRSQKIPPVRRKGGPSRILAGPVRNSITVQRGDTLFGIAKRAGRSIAELAAWNGLQPPYSLYVGQKLLVSPSPQVPAPKPVKDKPRYHTVVAGDTLYKIARRYSHSVKKIAVWNKLQSPYKLFVGQKLRVSEQATLKWTWTHKSTIHPTLPEFVFKLVGKPTKNGIKVEAIESRRGNESQPFQTLNVSAMPTITEDTVAFDVEDINFDGYHDMRLMESMLGTANAKYLYWLFEPQTGRFVKNTALSAIISPRVDAENKQIISAWRDGCCYYETDYYQVVDNKPLLVRQEKEEYDEAGTKKVTVWERVGGKLKLVSDGLSPAPEEVSPAPEATPKPTAPAPKEEAQGKKSNTHTVAAGDTLYSIARNYGQRIGDLATWNGLLPPYTLYVGQSVLVSDPSTPKWTLTHKNAIHPTFPELVFKLIGEPQEPDRVNIKAIEIRRGDETQPFQTLQVSGATPPINVPHPSMRFIIEDMNFDGYRDIRLMEYWPLRQSLWHPIPNIEYSYWLFEPKTGRFVSSLAFNAAKLGSPEFESEKKQIISHWELGCCEYGLDYYNIVNGKPLLVRQKKYEVDEATGTKKETVLARVVGGEMKLLSDTVPPDADKPADEAETSPPEADKPAADSETVSPEADKPADDSETVSPEADKPADDSETVSPEADKPAAESETVSPEADKPAAADPEAVSPEADKPTADSEKTVSPEADKPAADSETVSPDATESETVSPDADKPAAESETVSPEADKPAADSETVSPDADKPAADSETVSPDADKPADDSETVSPEADKPADDSETVSPEADKPAAESETVSPEADKPAAESETVSPEADKPAADSETVSPDADKPAADSETVSPEADKPADESETVPPEADKPAAESETVSPEADKPAAESETVSPEADKPAAESETVSPEADKPADESETVPPEADKPAADSETVSPDADKPADETETVPPEADKPVDDSETVSPEADKSADDSETVSPEADKPAAESETVSSEADKPAADSETVSSEADKPAADSETISSDAADSETASPDADKPVDESETVPPDVEDTADKSAAKQRGADKPADESAVSPTQEKQWLITKKPVTVHTAPNATIVVQLQIGTIVKQLARSDAQEKNGDSQHDWYHIDMADGKQGWILGHLTMSFDPEQKANLYRQIAQAQPLSLSEQTELTDFLARATDEVQSPPEMAAELALLQLLSLRKSIDQFDWEAYPIVPLDETAEKPLPSDYKTWLKKQVQERLIYHDDVQSTAAGHSVWHIHAHMFWKLHDKYYPLPITDRIAWAGARNSVGGICYGYFECDLRNLEDTTMSYLKYHPTGKYVAEALEEMATVLDNIIDQNQYKVLFESKESLKWLRHFAVLRATVERTAHPKKAQVLGKIDKLQKRIEANF
jgi:LysM repeat protein